MIEIDASQGEGGGQVLRSSLALSMCTGQPVALKNIRAKRPKPGLMRQHLACVHAAQAVSGAQVEAAELGSSTLLFRPGPVRAGDHRFSIGTAGSCTLVLQTIWPALLLKSEGESRIALVGGTHNAMAPPFHFIARCYLPLLRRLGVQAELTLRRHGFYPAGGGEIHAVLQGLGSTAFQPVDLMARGEAGEAHAESLLADVPHAVAERQFKEVAGALGWQAAQMRVPPLRRNEGPGQALMLTLPHAEVTELFTGFGAKGIAAEAVAREAITEAQAYLASGAALGPHLADQWTLPLSLAVWRSGRPARFTCSEISGHTSTHFDVISRFLPLRFGQVRQDGGGWQVSVSPA